MAKCPRSSTALVAQVNQERILDNPPHVPTSDTRRECELLVSFGLSVDEVAYVLKCTPYDVKVLYKDELQFGLARATALVGGALVKSAVAGDTKAAVFWLQARAGWTTRTTTVQQPADGKPEEGDSKQALMDRILAKLTPSQLGEIVATEAAKEQQPAMVADPRPGPGTGQVH